MAPDARSIPADRREWRPQRVDTKSGGGGDIHKPIAGPRGGGDPGVIFFPEGERADEWGTVEVIDERGEDASGSAPRAFDQLRRSVLAGEAVIDGIVTDQSLESGVDMEFDENRAGLGRDLAFVAIDLLSVDEQT